MSHTQSQQATMGPVPTDDVANLAIGVVHLVESRMPVTEQHRSVRFAALGAPGPTIGEIVRGRMQLERPHDYVLAGRTTRRCKVDWPGLKHAPVTIYWNPCNSAPRRESLAKEIADIIYHAFIANPHITVPWEDVRLLAISYYGDTWIPILALDSER
ncbi:hypothetical protein D9615_002068 [Tricholomella constricta]|uniref:Uncharacterized protein n=1 Tax=Tricholomella constricta TaxID=117010 RepID=A0A8H5HPC8_9AGAR|nr:hypothetical protein D9615_002068 [Tricholomella constricta]